MGNQQPCRKASEDGKEAHDSQPMVATMVVGPTTARPWWWLAQFSSTFLRMFLRWIILNCGICHGILVLIHMLLALLG